MRRLVVLAFVACSSDPTEVHDAGAPTSEAGVDAAPDVTVIDASTDPPTADACTRGYQAAPDGSVRAMYGTDPYDPTQPKPYTCDVACGAGGPYPYTLWQITEVTEYGHPRGPTGCTQDTAAPRLFCCATLVCTRHETLDVYCKATANPTGYRCDGPSSEPRPTRAGCTPMPNGNAAEFCCAD